MSHINWAEIRVYPLNKRMLNRPRAYLATDIDFKPLFDHIYPFKYVRSEVRHG